MEIEVTKISSKGQVVIPQALRRRLHLEDGETLAVSSQENLIVLKKLDDAFDKADLKTIGEIKAAWKEIAQGKCKRLSSEAFLDEVAQW